MRLKQPVEKISLFLGKRLTSKGSPFQVEQWCTAFFGHGPLSDLLNPLGPNRGHDPKQMNANQNL